ncbi:FAD-dependent oxidoreductase [Halomarina salina]|uniref:FAD-dependent oxidoreductase n=1 Tax=Halomarina salina TaxID=1872699 RepID=A0ABD5RKD7_9EURY|nr:FAD-dependent oxidoreductase [Halomarina salina]
MSDADGLPGRHASPWLANAPETTYDSLDGDATTESVVVGGGIAGLTTATLLAEGGRDVVLLERDRVGGGVTGRSTAKVTSQHGFQYATLERRHGSETARKYGLANQRAVQFVADRVESFDVDCRLERQPAFAMTDATAEIPTVRREVRASQRAGLPATLVEDGPADAVAGVRFADQLQFDPQRYLLALADAFVDAGGHLFEGTRVTDVDGGAPCRVETESGSVTASDVVLATHFPLLDRAGYFARQYPKRSYVLAVRADDPPTDGMYYWPGETYRSTRTAEVDGETLTLVGGQNHKTGQGGRTRDRYRRLESAARERFDVEDVVYRWSTQDYVSVDGIPYVGRLGAFASNVYAATGFGGWGMSNGTAAGLSIAGTILDRPEEWADAFDPLRVTVLSSVRELSAESANVARRFVGDWAEGLATTGDRLGRDEATVRRRGTDVLGVYRDEDGEDHVVDAVCPHMGCLVQWNDGERSWDCPCHGSRFAVDGRVLDGPATEDLPTEPSEDRSPE